MWHADTMMYAVPEACVNSSKSGFKLQTRERMRVVNSEEEESFHTLFNEYTCREL